MYVTALLKDRDLNWFNTINKLASVRHFRQIWQKLLLNRSKKPILRLLPASILTLTHNKWVRCIKEPIPMTFEPIKNDSGDDDDDDFHRFWNSIEENIEFGDYKQLSDVLKIKANDEDEKNELLMIHVLDILTSILIELDEINEADIYIERALTLVRTMSPEPNFKMFMESVFNLKQAKILSLKKRFEEAEEKFLQVKKDHLTLLNSDRSKSNNVLYLQILFWYCLHLIRAEKVQKANTIITEAELFFRHNMRNLKLKEEMIIDYTLSNLCTLIEEHDRALELMEHAIIIAKNTRSRHLAKYYLEIGQIYLMKDQYQLASVAFQDAEKTATQFQIAEVQKEAIFYLTFVGSLINDSSQK